MDLIYNTELAARAVGVHLPSGAPARADTQCMFCGRLIKENEACVKKTIARGSFMDDAWFAARSGVACVFCETMTSSSVTKALGSANCLVYTRDGVFPIAKDSARTWFLLTPPEPPFVVTASATINFQHVVWKGQTTYDHNMIFIAWPTRIMTIRHNTLMQAVEVCRELSVLVPNAKEAANTEALATKGKKSKPKQAKPISHPYIVLDRELNDINHGAFRPDISALAGRDPAIAERLEFLKQLTLGETWALATLVKAKQEEPIKPEPIVLDKNALFNKTKGEQQP